LKHTKTNITEWNSVALDLSIENSKIPSHRKKVESLPKVHKSIKIETKKSTNEWNMMALKVANKSFHKGVNVN
jgi:hypothetical protein